MSVNALQLNTGARIVIEPGTEKVSRAMETGTVPWTANGLLGVNGDTVVDLVLEERELELDSVTDLGMEEHRRISSEILDMASHFFYRLRLIFTA